MYVQFTSCVYGDTISKWMNIFDKICFPPSIQKYMVSVHNSSRTSSSLLPLSTVFFKDKLLLSTRVFPTFRSSHRIYSTKRAVLKNFTIFTEKHLRWSLFLIKLQIWRLLLHILFYFSHNLLSLSHMIAQYDRNFDSKISRAYQRRLRDIFSISKWNSFHDKYQFLVIEYI